MSAATDTRPANQATDPLDRIRHCHWGPSDCPAGKRCLGSCGSAFTHEGKTIWPNWDPIPADLCPLCLIAAGVA